MPQQPLTINWTAYILLTIAAVAFLVAGQFWLSDALESGQLGRTPAWAVFGPAFVWFAIDLVILSLLGRALLQGRLIAIGWLIIAVVCAVGTYDACGAVMSFIEVA